MSENLSNGNEYDLLNPEDVRMMELPKFFRLIKKRGVRQEQLDASQQVGATAKPDMPGAGILRLRPWMIHVAEEVVSAQGIVAKMPQATYRDTIQVHTGRMTLIIDRRKGEVNGKDI